MRAEEFDQKFDDGEDVTSDLDLAAIRRPGLEQRRVNVDSPLWIMLFTCEDVAPTWSPGTKLPSVSRLA